MCLPRNDRGWPGAPPGRAGWRWVSRALRALLRVVPLGLALPSALPAQRVTVTGWLSSVFTEEAPPVSPLRYFLADDRGRRLELLLDDAVAFSVGGEALRSGFRAEAEIEASPVSLRSAPAWSTPVHRVVRITRLSAPVVRSPALALTAYPYVTILCRFADVTTEPFSPAQVQTRMGNVYPEAGHYFGELSEGQASLAGSVTVGWYVLPKPRSQYISGTSMDFGSITTDCTLAANADVYFPQYQGVILQFNAGLSVRSVAPFDTLSFGGSFNLSLDGTNRTYPMVWMSREHVSNYVVLHHELGHSLGWPHSSGPYSNTYDSYWDIMSRGYIYQDPTFGYLGPHTIAYHKNLSGWLPPARVWRFGAGDPSSFLLLRTASPPAGQGFQAGILPISGTSRFLTVESRLVNGYDRGFPGEGVLLHEVNPARGDRTAQVVDPDGNGNPNDAAATWVPGERFIDPVSGYVVQVDSAVPEGFWVTIGDRSHALAERARSDSVLVGTAAIQPDSVRLVIFGADSLTGAWSVSHGAGASWVRLLTTSGQGSGLIRWERDPAGLPVGVYVDTLVVSLPGSVTSTPYLVDSLFVMPPLNLAVAPATQLDSIPMGQTAPLGASAALTLAGFGGNAANWSVSHGAAPWITLTTPSGTGSGMLTWSRNPAGLAAGTYVDTLQVTVAGAVGSPAPIIDSLVVYEPLIAVQCATSALLAGSGCLGSAGANYLDLAGNRDGTYNLGDLLAYLDRNGLPLPSAMEMRSLTSADAIRRPAGSRRAPQ